MQPTSPIRRLTLIRHAKAEADDVTDIERKLNARGLRDAATLGEWLQAENAFPQLFACSTARRTRQTLDAFSAIIPTILSERLYLASSKELLKFLQEMDDTVTHIGIVGHNPGLHQLATMLVKEYKNRGDEDRLALKFPTATCAILELPLVSWSALGPQSATLETYLTQKAA